MRHINTGHLGVAAAALLMVAAQPARAISVELQGVPASVVAGENFEVGVVVTGITDEIISAWDIDFEFDSTLLSNFLVIFDSFLLMGGPDAIGDVVFGAGLTDAFSVSLVSDADLVGLQCPGGVCGPTFLLATFRMQAEADGVPDIALVNWGLANDIKCANNEQCYPPKSVPEPGSLALLGLGLLGLGMGRRRGSA